MQKPAADIVYDFYWAASDLNANLLCLYAKPFDQKGEQISVTDPNARLPLTVPALRHQFEKYVRPFLALNSTDLPPDQLVPFSEIEDSLNEIVLPTFDELGKAWDAFTIAPSENVSRLREKCSTIREELGLYVITNASGMAKDMKPGVL